MSNIKVFIAVLEWIKRLGLDTMYVNEFQITRPMRNEDLVSLYAEPRRKQTPTKTFWNKWAHICSLLVPAEDVYTYLRTEDFSNIPQTIRRLMDCGAFGQKIVGKASKEMAAEDLRSNNGPHV